MKYVEVDSFPWTIKLGGLRDRHHTMESFFKEWNVHCGEKEIFISKAMTFHLLEHMANQSQAIDDAQLQNDIHVPENIDI